MDDQTAAGGGVKLLRVLVVDDEPWAREELVTFLSDRDDVEVVGEAATLDETIKLLDQHRPDLLFLDIQLRGEQGLELFERTLVRCHVVFVTAYEHHAVRAFDLNAVDYLVKPARPEKLQRAIARTVERMQGGAPKSSDRLGRDDRIYLREFDELRACVVADIVYLRAADTYTEVHLVDGSHVTVRDTLQAWEARLPDTFVRNHRSTLVNLGHVEALVRHEARWALKLRQGGSMLPISRRLLQSVREKLQLAR